MKLFIDNRLIDVDIKELNIAPQSGLDIFGVKRNNGRIDLQMTSKTQLSAQTTQSLNSLILNEHNPLTVVDSSTIDFTLAEQELTGSVISQMSITSDTSGLKLINDELSPTLNKYYGTDADAVLGYHSIMSGLTTSDLSGTTNQINLSASGTDVILGSNDITLSLATADLIGTTNQISLSSSGSDVIIGATNITLSLATADLIGTTNQISLSSSGSDVIIGATNITLSLPQDIDTDCDFRAGTLVLTPRNVDDPVLQSKVADVLFFQIGALGQITAGYGGTPENVNRIYGTTELGSLKISALSSYSTQFSCGVQNDNISYILPLSQSQIGVKRYLSDDGLGNLQWDDVVPTVINNIEITLGVQEISVSDYPFSFFENSTDGKVYCVNRGTGATYGDVSIIDTETNLVLNTLPFTAGAKPLSGCWNYSDNKIYIPCSNLNQVHIFNGDTDYPIGYLNTGTKPVSCCFNPDYDKVYTVNYTGSSVTIIDSANDVVIGDVSVGSSPISCIYDTDSRYIYIANSGAGSHSVSCLDGGSSNSVTATIDTTCTTPRSMAISITGKKLYVHCNNSKVAVIDIDTAHTGTTYHTLLRTISVGAGNEPSYPTICWNSYNNKIYVCNTSVSGDDTISIIDCATDTVVATVTIGDTPYGVAYNALNNLIYITLSNQEKFATIDGDTNGLTGKTPTGGNCRGIYYASDCQKIFIANYDENTVDIVGAVEGLLVMRSGRLEGAGSIHDLYGLVGKGSSIPDSLSWNINSKRRMLNYQHSMSDESELSFCNGGGSHLTTDGTYLFGNWAGIVKVDLSTGAYIGSQYSYLWGTATCLTFDGTNILTATKSNPYVIKINPTTLAVIGRYTILESGETIEPTCITTDGTNAYVGCDVFVGATLQVGRVLKVRLSDMTLQGTYNMATNELGVSTILWDNGILYACPVSVLSSILPTYIIKTSDMTLTARHSYHPSDDATTVSAKCLCADDKHNIYLLVTKTGLTGSYLINISQADGSLHCPYYYFDTYFNLYSLIFDGEQLVSVVGNLVSGGTGLMSKINPYNLTATTISTFTPNIPTALLFDGLYYYYNLGTGLKRRKILSRLNDNHNLLSLIHSDTTPATAVQGDLIISPSNGLWARYAKGTSTQLLGGDGTDTKWVSISVSHLPTMTSANLYGLLTDETGTSSGTPLAVFNQNPTLGGLSLTDATNIVMGTSTGTKIGTATNQKLSFYNSTPIVQPTGAIFTALTNLGLVATPSLSHTLLGDIGTLTHATLDSYLNQAVKTTSIPTFDSVICSSVKPPLDTTTAFQVKDSIGTCFVNFDTLNHQTGFGLGGMVCPSNVAVGVRGKLGLRNILTSIPDIPILRPSGDGDNNDFEGDYSAIDEVIADEDTSYTYLDYSLTIPIEDVKIGVKENGTTTWSSDISPTTSYQTYSYQWNTRPSDGGAWTPTDINNLQVGLKEASETHQYFLVVLPNLSSSSYTINYVQVYARIKYNDLGGGFGQFCCTQMYVVVNYTKLGNNWNTLLTSDSQSVDLDYILPLTAPAVNNAMLTSTTAGAMSWTSVIAPANGGTGVANGTNNTLTYSGNYALTLTLTNTTSLTLPTSGTLATTSQLPPSASDTVAGIVELAIASEVTTGTSTSLAITPDALAGSTIFGYKSCSIQVVDGATNVAVNDGQAYLVIPVSCNGMNLVRANAVVITAGSTGATTIDIYSINKTHDVLSGAISIASGGTVGTVGTINTSYDDVATNDVYRIDVTTVSGTAPKGLVVILEFQLP